MKKILLALAISAGAVAGAQAAFFNEPFNYPDGGIVSNSAGVWVQNTGNAGTCLVSNNTLQIWNNNGTRTEDIAHFFSPGYTNAPDLSYIYTRFSAQWTGDSMPSQSGTYFFSFATDTLGHFSSRTFASRTNVLNGNNAPDGSFYLGVENGSGSVPPAAGQVQYALTTNVFYTVVVRQCLTNGLATIWVGTDPVAMTEEGTPHATADDSPFYGTSNFVQWVCFRQASGEGTMLVKNLKVGKSWGEVFFAPEISPLSDQSIPKGGSTAALPFTVSSATVAANVLRVTATSSNPTLVPEDAAHLALTSDASGTNRTVTVTPVAAQQGSAIITLTVSDGTDSSSTSFRVAVGAPTAGAIANVIAYTNTTIPGIPFTVSDAEGDTITFTTYSGNTNVLKSEKIVITGSAGNYTATLTPEAGQFGWARVYIHATDSYTTNTTSFVLTVAPKLGLVFSDNFAYSDWAYVPNALTEFTCGSPWITASGNAYEIQVTNGLGAFLVSTNTEDAAAPFTNLFTGDTTTPYYTSNAIVFYTSFQLNASELGSGNADYFLHLKAGPTSTTFDDKVFAGTNGAAAGKFRVGVANTGGAPSAIFPMDLDLNTTYTVVTRYNSATGESVLWVNPGNESSTKVAATDNLSTSYIGAVGLRQPSSRACGQLTVNALKIGTSWSDVAASITPATITSTTYDNGTSTLTVTYNGDPGMNFQLLKSTDLSAPSASWTPVPGAANTSKTGGTGLTFTGIAVGTEPAVFFKIKSY